ncbi:MAG: GMP synthase (glutamine-hydrolyzing) [Syntrophomonadaceae bacterium]|nr:GMP synthase (glutamine-hydrolyzing) [Bacillota bacterium]
MILILDFGSQYTHLIARRIREMNVFSEVLPFNAKIKEILKRSPSGIILSGGPASVFSKGAPFCDSRVFTLNIPILGICYGMQLLAKIFGGEVIKDERAEYGKSMISTHGAKNPLFKNLPGSFNVWMSHSDRINKLPHDFCESASTENVKYAAFANTQKKLYGVQFHPEVTHTQFGKEILKNFIFQIANSKKDWNLDSFVTEQISEIRKKVKDSKVICGISGGIDSSTAAMLLKKAIGKKLICIFVDNGLLRKKEAERVKEIFQRKLKFNMRFVHSRDVFLNALKGVEDPEKKRKIIGKVFIDVFEREAKKIKNATSDGGQVKFLAQGTLYPDVIESLSVKGPSATIKSHHNVGGLPEKMGLKLIEPLRYLFKDEVRMIARTLKLPDEIVNRQPFPGPGLAVRIIGEVTPDRLKILQDADWLMIDEMKKSGYYYKVWQSFAVLLPIKTVGVMGDRRTYENVVAIRVVESFDGMTADFSKIPYAVLEKISTRIVNEVRGVNRVVYDITSKPPATIEWE